MKRLLHQLILSALLLSSPALGAGLAGSDADGNGVRDDVDTYIRGTATSPAQRTAADPDPGDGGDARAGRRA